LTTGTVVPPQPVKVAEFDLINDGFAMLDEMGGFSSMLV
jgi:hypothetical protein